KRLCNQSPDFMEKIDEHALSAGLMLIFSILAQTQGRTAHDDIDANHKNSRNRNDQSRCRPGQSVCDPAERSSRHRGPLPNGKIDQWYSQQERRGVVFILNVTDPAVARTCSKSYRWDRPTS